MKKLIAVVLIAVVVLAAFLLLRRPGFKLPFADVFPEGAIGYLGVRGGAELAHDMISSNSWKKLSGVESVRDLKWETRSEIERSTAPLPTFGTLTSLLGEETAAAIYGKESRFGRSVLAAVRTRDEGEAILTIIKSGFGGKATGNYRGSELYSFRIPAFAGLEGIYARGVKTSIAVLSQSNPMKLMKAALDLSAGEEGRPLSGNKSFRAGLGAPLRGAGTFIGCGYFDVKAAEKNFQGLKTLLAARMREKSPAAADTMARGGMGQFPYLSWGGYLYRRQGLAGKLHARLDGAQMDEEQRALLGGGSGKLELLGYAPGETIALDDSRLGNVDTLWKWFKKWLRPNALGILAFGFDEIGINFEREVLPWLGDEMNLLLSDVLTGGLLPLPRAGLVLSVKDPSAAEKTLTAWMERVTRKPAAQGPQTWAFLKPEIRREDYKGVKISTLAYPIPGFSPSFAIRDRRLIAGIDRTSVETIIDAGAGARDSILSNRTFAEMRKVLPGSLNRLSYIDCERALDAGEGVARWMLAVRKLTTTADDPEAARVMEKVEADLPRIFAALKVFRAAMAGRSVRGDAIDQYLVLRMRDI